MNPVWIIDDDRSIRWVFEKALAREGISHRTFEGAQQALDRLPDEQPQVVVSDISGVELSKADHARVVVQHPDLPGVVELDVSTAEAAKLADWTLRLVAMTVYAPDQPPRQVSIETNVLDRAK